MDEYGTVYMARQRRECNATQVCIHPLCHIHSLPLESISVHSTVTHNSIFIPCAIQKGFRKIVPLLPLFSCGCYSVAKTTTGCLKLHVSFRQRATTYKALLRKMTYEDQASYGFSAPCTPVDRVHSTEFIRQGSFDWSRVDLRASSAS